MTTSQIEIHTSPDSPLLRKACAKVVLDEHYSTAWSDSTPRNFQAWMEKFKSQSWLPYVWTMGGEIAGLQWAHDLGLGPDGGYAWMGGSVMRPFRGKRFFDLRMEAWGMVRSILEQEGYPALLGASIVGNQAAFSFITACGYTALGVYKDMVIHRGQLVDVVLYALRPQDRSLLWILAEQRAQESHQTYQELVKQRTEEAWRHYQKRAMR